MVYVLNKNGIPLMPTKRHGKVSCKKMSVHNTVIV